MSNDLAANMRAAALQQDLQRLGAEYNRAVTEYNKMLAICVAVLKDACNGLAEVTMASLEGVQAGTPIYLKRDGDRMLVSMTQDFGQPKGEEAAPAPPPPPEVVDEPKRPRDRVVFRDGEAVRDAG
jgi:hypothetical protein